MRYLEQVDALVARPGVTRDALAQLGAKARRGTLDLEWLNSTEISDRTLDFLGRDRRTPWDALRMAAEDPTNERYIRWARGSLRGAGAELVAQPIAQRLGSNVRRQMAMGGSEIDYGLTIRGKERGLEVKGWTPPTWQEALDAYWTRAGKKGLDAAQRKAVEKVDHMIGQLSDVKQHTRQPALLAVTDGLSEDAQGQLKRLLRRERLADTELVPLSEAKIKETAAGELGEPLGIPRPGRKR
jgi:hypothetical protein